MQKPDLSAADQCVMCGMCHPHCPTYQANRLETESPRGRISMMLGLEQNQLSLDNSVIKHLNNCTGCGACERMCPSRVPFMQLMDNSRELIYQQTRQPAALKSLLYLTAHPKRYPVLKMLAAGNFITSLLRKFRLLPYSSRVLQQAISSSNLTIDSYYPATTEAIGTLGLFTGCISRLFDQKTLVDTIKLLTAAGYNIEICQNQVCCGALHQHNGDLGQARRLQQQNQSIFNRKSLDAIIVTSTGCTAQLKPQLDRPVYDILEFIRDHKLLKKLELNTIEAEVLIHEPCSQRNVLRLPSFEDILEQVNRLRPIPLEGNSFCCGAGGANMLLDHASAIDLRAPKLDAISQKNAQFLATTNYGCALHLKAGLLEKNLLQNKQIEILHPVSLLVRSLSLK